jgi:chorismate mutase
MHMLEKLRVEQDEIDKEIVAAIAKRLAVRKRISAFRLENNLSTIDPDRVKIVLGQAETLANEMDVPSDMARGIFELLIDWSHRLDVDWRKNPEKLKAL